MIYFLHFVVLSVNWFSTASVCSIAGSTSQIILWPSYITIHISPGDAFIDTHTFTLQDKVAAMRVSVSLFCLINMKINACETDVEVTFI